MVHYRRQWQCNRRVPRSGMQIPKHILASLRPSPLLRTNWVGNRGLPLNRLKDFTPQQQETLARFGHSDSDYFRLLGRNLPVLEQRTLTDKGIFFTAGGLPRKDRELAAAVASKINGCIYCASVHARKAAQLSKESEAVQRFARYPSG